MQSTYFSIQSVAKSSMLENLKHHSTYGEITTEQQA